MYTMGALYEDYQLFWGLRRQELSQIEAISMDVHTG